MRDLWIASLLNISALYAARLDYCVLKCVWTDKIASNTLQEKLAFTTDDFCG